MTYLNSLALVSAALQQFSVVIVTDVPLDGLEPNAKPLYAGPTSMLC